MRTLTESLLSLVARANLDPNTGLANFAFRAGMLQGIILGLPDTPENRAFLKQNIAWIEKDLASSPRT